MARDQEWQCKCLCWNHRDDSHCIMCGLGRRSAPAPTPADFALYRRALEAADTGLALHIGKGYEGSAGQQLIAKALKDLEGRCEACGDGTAPMEEKS
jgi:hypothetical protein